MKKKLIYMSLYLLFVLFASCTDFNDSNNKNTNDKTSNSEGSGILLSTDCGGDLSQGGCGHSDPDDPNPPTPTDDDDDDDDDGPTPDEIAQGIIATQQAVYNSIAGFFSNFVTNISNYVLNVLGIRNDTKDISKDKEQVAIASACLNEPLQLASGANVTQSVDFNLKSSTIPILISRNYNSQEYSSHTIGKTWKSSLDTRIIMGVDKLAVQYYFDLVAYSAQLNYSQRINQLNTSISALQNVPARHSQANALISQIQNLLDQLQAQNNDLTAKLTVAKKEMDLTLSNDSKNDYVYNETDPEILKFIGSNKIIFIDEKGIHHTFTIDEPAVMDSTENYSNGFKNYYPFGSSTTPDKYTQYSLYLNDDGSYVVTKDKLYNYYYNENGLLQKVEDLNGNYITYSYDVNEDEQKITLLYIKDKSGRKVQFEYYNDGTLKTIIDPNGAFVTYAYDNGFLTAVTGLNGITTRFSYNTDGLLEKIIKPDDSFLSYRYQKINDKFYYVGNTDEEGNNEFFSFSEDNKLVTITGYAGEEIAYYLDDRANTIKTVYQDGTYESFLHDSNDNVISQRNRLGEIINFVYDSQNRLIQKIYPDFKDEIITYNEFDKPLTIKDRAGNVTSFEYDNNANLVSVNYPDGSTVIYEYYHNPVCQHS